MSSVTAKCLLVTLVSFFSIIVGENLAQYVPPTPSVEPLYPKGLRMSIPDEDGISLVAYHVKFNEDFNGLEAGTIARDIIKVRNGRWIYEDRTTRLKRGDKIYYWIHVVYDGLGYNLLDQQYVVNDFYNYDGTPVSASTVSNIVCATPSETKVFQNVATVQQLRRQNTCPGQLIFEENFDLLNTSRWLIVERFVDVPATEFVVYMNNIDNVEAKGGILHIRPTLMRDKYGEEFIGDGTLTLERCTGNIGTTDCKRTGLGAQILPPIISGRVNSQPSFTFLYGHVQIRAKLPRGDWIYPLITLEAREKYTDNSSVFCNIIVAHSNGNPVLRSPEGYDLSGYVLLGGAHALNIGQNKIQDNRASLPAKISNSLWSDDYHVYDLEWRSGRITVRVDGEQYGEQKVPALYDTPASINLGVAVGGSVTFPDGSFSDKYMKPWRNAKSKAFSEFYQAKNNWLETWRNKDNGLHVDYVKVWAI
ncbi:Beta-1,3-glucan-binding protein 1 [Anthophora retusa]